jgi:putative membrane protein
MTRTSRRAPILLPLILLPLAIAACSPTPSPPPAASTPPPPPPAHVALADVGFAIASAQSSLFARQISQLAVQRATRQGIKDFAQSVIDTETKSAGELAGIMHAKGLDLPDSLTPAQSGAIQTLSNTQDGPRFAWAYFSALVKSQIASLQQMEAYASSGTDPELKSFAAEQVAILRDQLARARQVPRQRGAAG